MIGTLFGIGVGPGSPDLLTIRAARVIARVPIVCVPRSAAGSRSYALGVVQNLIDPGRQEIVELTFPMSRAAEQAQQAHADAVARVLSHLVDGRDVAFLSEGDPLFYSTFIYLSRGLRSVCPAARVEVVPGVSSINAAAAATGCALAEGGETVAIVPALYDTERLRHILTDFDNVVLLKIHAVWERVLDLLEQLGLAAQAIVVTRAGAPEETVTWDIRELRGKKLDYFSLVLVKKIAGVQP